MTTIWVIAIGISSFLSWASGFLLGLNASHEFYQRMINREIAYAKEWEREYFELAEFLKPRRESK